MWYYVCSIWKSIICCSSQAIVSHHVSFSHDDSVKHSQALHLLNCVGTSLHEASLLAETVNKCKAKVPQRKNKTKQNQTKLGFKAGKFSDLGDSAVLQSSITSAVSGGGMRAQTSTWDRDVC